jgi:histidinol-phosphate aminotransferase
MSCDTFIETLRSEIRDLPKYESGLSLEYVRAHYRVDEIAKLGSNENPFGASPQVVAAIADSASGAALYPDPSSDDLRAALSRHLGVSPDRIALGNGSEDLIAIAAHTFLAPGADVVTIAPSFGLHVIFPLSMGARVRTVVVKKANAKKANAQKGDDGDYCLDMGEFIAAVTPETRMVIFSNPSNPLGSSISAEDMSRLFASLNPRMLLVFDEAYFEYAAADPSYPRFLKMLEQHSSPWLLLRTFSKAYGLAGLRVGYAVASDASLLGLMDRVRTPFNVNRLAQVAAVAALRDMAHSQDCVARTIQERERVRRALGDLGYRPAPSRANFLFFDAREDSSELAARLLTHGVIVKPWREPGFSEHVRVSIGSPRANDQFLKALSAVANYKTNPDSAKALSY